MSDSISPKVSVCIPTYNYGRYIADAIGSVLSQTYSDFELVIVDNCSVDETREVVEQFIKQDKRIIYSCNETNLGMVGNWNKCLEYASGDFVNILCADDMLRPEFLAKSLALFHENENIVLVSCARSLVSETLKSIGTRNFSGNHEQLNGYEVINRCLIELNIIGEPSAVIFRKELSSRGFNSNYNHLTDLEMWFHLLEQGDFAYIPEQLCRLRMHTAQETNANINNMSAIVEEFSLFTDFSKKKYVHIPLLKEYDRKYNIAFALWEKSIDAAAKKNAMKLIKQNCSLFLFRLFCIQKQMRRLVTTQQH